MLVIRLLSRLWPSALRAVLVFGLLCAVLPSAAQAQTPEPDCSNPQSAADSLFVWLQPGSYDPAQAATCLDWDEPEAKELAVKLKQTLDARNHWVPVSSMSEDPNWVNAEGEHRLVPMPEEFPVLVLQRNQEGDWLYARSTLEQVPRLHRETFSAVSRWFQSQLPDVFYSVPIFNLYLWQYLYGFLLVLVAWIVGRIVHLLMRSQAHNLMQRAKLPLDMTTYQRLQKPIVALAMGLVIRFGIPDLQLSIGLTQTLHVATSVLIALSCVLVVSRIVDVIARVLADKAATSTNKLAAQVVPLAHQAARVVVWVIGVLFILQNQGVEVWSFMAGLGIGGLAFALAAKDTLANLFGSVNIFMDKPFQVGDWVIIGDVEGMVEEVGFRSTRVRTFYNSLITIPNHHITNSNVDNMGARSRRRVYVTLGVTYDTPSEKLQAFVEGIRAILAAHPSVQKSYEVHFYNFGSSALELLVWFHLVVPSWTDELEARADVFHQVLRVARELGVSFAFPSTSLYLESTPEHPKSAPPSDDLADLEAVVATYGPGGPKARAQGSQFSRSWAVPARTRAGSADDDADGG